MLGTQPNCILSEQNFKRQKAMKNGNSNDHLVFTLEDDISGQVLKSKNDENTASGSSSVALWIKSLKENSIGFDDTNQDYRAYSGSSSDQDDLGLGAEATDLRKKHITHKHLASFRDSDSDGSARRYSWTGQRSFLTNRLSYDRSIDSDTSGRSSVTSVSSLLTARESDPEDVLKGLGFRGPSVLDKIPDRFIDTGTICDGVDSEQFLSSVQDSEDALYSNSEVPPWVMARFNDIPRKFWKEKEEPLECQPTNTERRVPLTNEPDEDDASNRPAKICPSKFGTYLEPVTEEAELSSQGSATLSPTRIKALSFESNRSTLKANSQDGPSESMPKIPSLSDLWQATDEEQEMNAMRNQEHGIAVEDTRDNEPENGITFACSTPGHRDQGCTGDWIDKSREDSQWSLMPSLADIQVEDVPLVNSGQWCCPQVDSSVPSLSAYFTDNDTSCLGNYPSQADCEPTNSVFEDDLPRGNVIPTMTQKHPHLTIPTISISEPGEKNRKISTIDPPDIEKLLPIVWPKENSQNTPSLSEVTRSTIKNNSKTKGKITCKTKQIKPTQLNQYGAETWAVVKSKRHPQVQFSQKGKPRSPRRLTIRSRRTADVKATISVSQCKKAKQVTVPRDKFESIPCFSNVLDECTRNVESNANAREFKQRDKILQHTGSVQWNTKPFRDRNAVSCSKRESNNREIQDERLTSNGQSYSSKDDFGASSNDFNSGACVKNGMSIEEELDGLQSSLKGVKMYKAGIHLMQLASSVETVMCSEKRPRRLQVRSNERLLGSIQNELKRLEEYILGLQKQLKGIKKQSDNEEMAEDRRRRESDFSDITRQLLQEQLKMFNSISTPTAVSPDSTPSVSREPSLCSETPDVLRHTDVMKLRKEIQELRQDSEERNTSLKEEILAEVKAEIRNCFKEFLLNERPVK